MALHPGGEDCGVPLADLEALARGKLRGAARRMVQEHRLQGCRSCRERLQAIEAEIDRERADRIEELEFEAERLPALLAVAPAIGARR